MAWQMELKKYDMWNWADKDSLTKQIVKKHCSLDQEEPESDESPIRMMKTNDYKYIYDAEIVNDIFADFFNGNYPARSVVQISALPLNANIEIEAIGKKI